MVSEPVVYDDNQLASMAEKFVRLTLKCLFLTGKAGTGKTTFLHRVRETCGKNNVVVAPTGVAAVNAGGTTIHSFFQLPFTPFLPQQHRTSGNLAEIHPWLHELRIDREKIELFRQLELLIIDEVSMVRGDVLDAIDVMLRFYRRRESLAFGGVQVLLIGDLFQLPPVVKGEEWSLLSNYYKSPFFFDSRVFREASPVYIELKKIYRQRDREFIRLLNAIRNGSVTESDLSALHARYLPGFRPPRDEGYITLTTHNQQADRINAAELAQLPGEATTFDGTIEGEFPEKLYPTEKQLTLRKGAQIMFLRNDMERPRRYFNGKIGRVIRIEDDRIVVVCTGEETEIEVEREVWNNVRYTYNSEKRKVEQEVVGTFTQYAIRLAWAITVHKSQGLTFDKVIIDAGSAFAPGQVYVALSRCTTLEGIVLFSKIPRSSVRTDPRIFEFCAAELEVEKLQPVLEAEMQRAVLQTLSSVFDFTSTIGEIKHFVETLESFRTIDHEEAYEVLGKVCSSLEEQQEFSLRFSRQLEGLAGSGEFDTLQQRVEAGTGWFDNAFDKDIILPLKEYCGKVAQRRKVRKFVKRLRALISLVELQKNLLARASHLCEKLRGY